MNYATATLLTAITALVFTGCGGDNRIEPKNTDSSNSSERTGIFSDGDQESKTPSYSVEGIHEVEVLEVLETDKYSYLRVKENEEPYWIATIKSNFVEGEKYEYQGGLLKTNFKSIEHNRTFDKVYLVSQIRPPSGETSLEAEEVDTTPKTVSSTFTKPDLADLVDLGDIVENLP